MKARKDAAYEERNKVVAALAKLFPSGVAKTAIEGWSEDWHGCVYIDLPTGQVSWHFHDSQAYLFDGLPSYPGTWDGHDTPEKYRRLAALQSTQGQTASAITSHLKTLESKYMEWCGYGRMPLTEGQFKYLLDKIAAEVTAPTATQGQDAAPCRAGAKE